MRSPTFTAYGVFDLAREVAPRQIAQRTLRLTNVRPVQLIGLDWQASFQYPPFQAAVPKSGPPVHSDARDISTMTNTLRQGIANRKVALLCSIGFAGLGFLFATPLMFKQSIPVVRMMSGWSVFDLPPFHCRIPVRGGRKE